MIVVDKLSKMAHFLPLKKNVVGMEVAHAFNNGVVRLHGLPMSIISDRDSKFIGQLWRDLMKVWDVRVRMSTSYHP